MSRGAGGRPPVGLPRRAAGRWSAALRSRRLAAVLAAVLAVAVFANSLSNGFAYDDVPLLVENESVHSLSELPGTLLEPYWSNLDGPASRELGLWRPVTTAFLTAQWSLWGDDPLGYHAVNVLLHGAATALVVLLLADLTSVAAGLLGGAVFAVHPVHVEAVANVVGVADLLAALLVLAASVIWIRERGPPSAGRLGVLCVLYALAFLTKESAAVLPGVLLLLDAWRDRLSLADVPEYARRRGAAFASLAATAGAILWLRLQVLGSVADPQPPLGAELLQEIPRIWTVAAIWPHYVRLLFFPADLSPDYAPAVIDVHLGWNAVNLTGVALALAFLALAWVAWRSPSSGSERPDDDGRPVTLAVLWFVVTVLPVANVLFLTGVLLAERTLYLPSVGVAIGAGWILAALLRRRPRPVAAGLVLVIVLMAGRTWTATPVWRSTDSVFDHLLVEHPESAKLQWALARRFHDGDRSRASRAAARRAIGLGGANYNRLIEVARRFLSGGSHGRAEALAELLWRDRPDRREAPALLAAARVEQGDDRGVLGPGGRALELDPGDATTHHVVAVALRRLGRWDEAIAHREAVIAAGEGHRWQQWRWLGDLRLEVGDTSAAIAALDSAQTRAPAGGQVARMLDSLRGAWASGTGSTPETAPAEGPDRVRGGSTPDETSL